MKAHEQAEPLQAGDVGRREIDEHRADRDGKERKRDRERRDCEPTDCQRGWKDHLRDEDDEGTGQPRDGQVRQ